MPMARSAAYAEEKAEVEVLKGQVTKHDDISKRLRGLQGRLKGDGHSVADSIGPVRDNTREVQVIASNVEKLVKHIDTMLVSGQDKAREEKLIRAGPVKVGIEEYLNCLRRLERSLEQFSASKMKIQQQTVGDYNELLSEGLSKVQDYFRKVLSDLASPIEPLGFITKDKPFPTLPPDQLPQLRSIERCLSTPTARSLSYNQRENVLIRTYPETRANYLSSSLQSLSLASITTSKRRNADEPYRQGNSAIGSYAIALEGIFRSEFHNISAIFSREDWGVVFEATCRKALAELAKTLRELNMQIKANITTDCFLGYEIIETITQASQRLGQETGELKLPFSDALKPVRETAKSSIPELLEDQRRRITSMQTLPVDGAAMPFTTETMTRLQTMTAYPKSLSSILASLGDGNWTSGNSLQSMNSSASLPSLRSLDVGADGTALLAHYVLDTIDTHLITLEARSRMLHKSKAVSGVMIYNTVALIDRMIRSSDLASLLSGSGSAQSKMDNWRKKATATYMDSWKEPCSALLDVVYMSRPSNRPQSQSSLSSAEIVKSLSSKDKDSIKEKFKHFNASFDECVRRHKEMMPAMEREVRSGLAREIGNMTEPLYTRFFDRYEAMDRGRGKYVKYDKGSLSAILAGLG
ncbi:MAG: exocyst complex component exo70 [Ramalina farinacea]|uniref:Exocyst complex protein EXO70 n=1 Tax=Ramalina farinacea TaxID=258253 RepID=A0AA43QEV7_9LECA|nr:exocyst complex component exo70 [Ramalina farinacea]